MVKYYLRKEKREKIWKMIKGGLSKIFVLDFFSFFLGE